MKWKSKKYLAVLLAFVLAISNLSPSLQVFAAISSGQSVGVTQMQRVSGAGNGYFTVDGAASYGYCAQNSLSFWSNNTTKYGTAYEWNDATVRKVLYYAPGGPGYSGPYYGNLGADMDYATYAIGKINGDTSNNTKANAFINYVSGLSDPLSSGYTAYKADIASPYQDVAFLGYEAPAYTVSYDANGGTGAPAAHSFIYNGGQAISSTVPTRSGYTFVNWKATHGDYYFNPGDTIPNGWGNFTLVAQWSANQYTIKFDANGGTGAPDSINIIAGTAVTIPDDIPTREGYKFKYWNPRWTNNTYDGIYTEYSNDYIKYSYVRNSSSSDVFEILVYTENVSNVSIPTWTAKDGQDDLIWHQASSGEWEVDGKPYNWRAEIKLSDHKGEHKNYYSHIYANPTSGGTVSVSGLDNYYYIDSIMNNLDIYNGVNIDINNDYIKRVWLKKVAGSANFEILVYSTAEVNSIPTWTWSNGQDELVWHTIGSGSWTRNGLTYNYGTWIPISNHNHELIDYITHIYANNNTTSASTGYYNMLYGAGDTFVGAENYTLFAEWEPTSVYNITYELDEGTNNPDNPDTYVAGEGVEKLLEPTKDGYQFKGWYEDADFTVPIESISSERAEDLTLYAKWDQLIVVVYDENITEDGATKQDVVSKEELDAESNGKYAVKENEGYTDYKKENAKFRGWDNDRYQSPVNASFQNQNLPEKIEFDELLSLAYGSSTYSLRSRSVAETTTVDDVEGVPVVNLYAIWDNAPEIFTEEDSILEFYEGEYVTKEMLLKNVLALDSEDGYISDIRITKINYSEGKLENGEKQDSYEVIFDEKEGMTDADVLDTWFLQMEKDAVVTHTITYEVTDSYGNTTTFQWPVKVKYNEAPEIQGADRYFTLKEAKDGKITLETLLEQARAWDKEDCSEHCSDGKHGLDTCLNQEEACEFTTSKLSVLGYDADKFTKYTKAGYEILSYHVIDQYGKETLKQFVVYILDDQEEIINPTASKTVRFIDQKYYKKNYDISLSGLSEKEMGQLNQKEEYQNGGLSVGSDWYTNAEYRILLMGDEETSTKGVFDRIKDDSLPAVKQWYFTKQEISSVKEYVKTNGIGNSKDENGLRNFLALFPVK